MDDIEVWRENYGRQLAQLRKLSAVAVKELMGLYREDDDPKVRYAIRQHRDLNLLTAQVATLTNVVQILINIADPNLVSHERYRQLISEEMDRQLKSMEEELCITGWDPEQNPLFDLPRWQAKIQDWPK